MSPQFYHIGASLRSRVLVVGESIINDGFNLFLVSCILSRIFKIHLVVSWLELWHRSALVQIADKDSQRVGTLFLNEISWVVSMSKLKIFLSFLYNLWRFKMLMPHHPKFRLTLCMTFSIFGLLMLRLLYTSLLAFEIVYVAVIFWGFSGTRAILSFMMVFYIFFLLRRLFKIRQWLRYWSLFPLSNFLNHTAQARLLVRVKQFHILNRRLLCQRYGF